MSKISAVIITLNEEQNIAMCLDSLQSVVDEVVVVDSFSTDKTVEICRSKGATVYQREWQGYAATKNLGHELATHNYILSIDADEVLSDTLKHSILAHKKHGLEGVYECKRLTNYCGKWIRHGGWYPDKKIRLFPKDRTEWTGQFVHETLTFAEDMPKTLLKGELLHYSFHTVRDHYERIEKYTELEAKKKFSAGKKQYLLPMVFSPLVTFLKMYVLKLGFLDGYYGLVIAMMSGYANFKKYQKLGKLINA